MGENIEEAQQDWIGASEQIRANRLSLKRAAYRVGLAQFAHLVGLDETTLRNQIDWRPRKDGSGNCWKPSADVEFHLFNLDQQYRTEKLGQCKERIAPIEDLTPEDFMRHVMAKAIAGGFHPTDRDEVLGLAQRVKKGGSR